MEKDPKASLHDNTKFHATVLLASAHAQRAYAQIFGETKQFWLLPTLVKLKHKSLGYMITKTQQNTN